jgi:hypothetical protein
MPSAAVLHSHYDAERREFHITFRGSDRRYAYLGVPAEVYQAFREATSKGRFVNAVIKPNYPVREITGPAGRKREEQPGQDRRKRSAA